MSIAKLISLGEATKILKAEGVVGMPTETVYGLAGRIDSTIAIQQIFAVKERPFFDPLIVHVASLAQAQSLVTQWPQIANVLAENFWPGPLTMILPKVADLNPMITSGLETVALRWPQHPLAQELIQQVGVPLAAPSANKFGRTSPTRAAHVLSELAVPVMDGGPCSVGIESTVIEIQLQAQPAQVVILRQGMIKAEQITTALQTAGMAAQVSCASAQKNSPGHLQHHYMPAVPLIVCEHQPPSQQALARMITEKLQQIPEQIEGIVIQRPAKLEQFYPLLLPADPILAARELYQKLRDGSAEKPDLLYFVVPPGFVNHQDWAGIKDRLYKAASLVLTTNWLNT